jgi:hypothetical protein
VLTACMRYLLYVTAAAWIGLARGGDDRPAIVTACIVGSGTSTAISWTVRNQSPKAIDVLGQTLPWGPPPYGAALVMYSTNDQRNPQKAIYSPGSDRSMVKIEPGQERRGAITLASVFPNWDAARATEFSVQWKCDLQLAGERITYSFEGRLTEKSRCLD